MTNEEIYDSLEIRKNITSTTERILLSDVQGVVKKKTATMIANKSRYAAIARRFSNPGVKWWLIAVIHEMECSQSFNHYLGNGQRLNMITTIVPIGRGPFKTFEEGAVDALRLKKVNSMKDWSIGGVLKFLEAFNGFGYSMYHNMPSPYLFSGSTAYTKGKYVADGKFDKNAVSTQIGIALLLKEIIDK